MAIRGQELTINLYAFNVTNNLPASGLTDVSGYIIKDGAAPAPLTNSISEPSASNVPGIYEVTLSSTEMNANWVTIGGKSFSNPTGVVVYPIMIATEASYLPLLSGYTDSLEAGQTTIEGKIDTISGYTDTLEATVNTISGNLDDKPTIDTIVSSGNAAGWDATATAVTVSGHTPGALSEIVSSGDAAGWNIYSDATLANQTEILNRVTNVSGLITALNDPTIGQIVSGIFDEVIAGTKDYRTAVVEMWAYTANKVDLSSTVSGVLHTYYDPSDSGLFTFEALPSGRIRTDL